MGKSPRNGVKPTSNRSLLNIQGQISIMIGSMMATFILFFVFVINTGMLVHAKINLQNAADLAAYAGAAVQARQLTHISYINYEMRRQWKKFLYRVYTLGNSQYDSFPKGPGGGPMQYVPNSSTDSDIQFPTTCLDPSVQECRNSAGIGSTASKLPGIIIPASNTMDPITDALRGSLQQIEAIRQDRCKGKGLTSVMLNAFWLYNTDPDLAALTAAEQSGSSIGSAESAGDKIQRIASMMLITSRASGLGIVPEEIILRLRIKTLESYVNTPAQKGIDFGTASSWNSNETSAPMRERSISAFKSAFYTLGNFTFPGDTVTLDELQPDTVLQLNPINASFGLRSIDYELITTADGSADCIPRAAIINVTNPLTLGYYKAPTPVTFYAVRLNAKANILFSPFGQLSLTAYAAAKPFGSTIGPSDQEVSFTFTGGDTQLPNASVLEGDPVTVGKGMGFDTNAMNGTLGAAAAVTTQNVDPTPGYKLAMAPNPWETKRYNIFNDLGGNDSFITNFSGGVGSIWAPLSATGGPAEAQGEIMAAIQGVNNVSNINPKYQPNVVEGTLQSGLANYINSLVSGQGASKEGFFEGFNVMRFSDPYSGNPPAGALFATTAAQVKSSWNGVKQDTQENIRGQGRVGYSVKFVSFSSLSNSIIPDGQGEHDFPSIKH